MLFWLLLLLIIINEGLFFEQHQPIKKGQVIAPEYEWESGVSKIREKKCKGVKKLHQEKIKKK